MSAALGEAARQAIEHACERLVLRSIRAFDERDWKGYAALFTPDGLFIRANAPDAPLTGREAILAALAARPAARLTRHLCTNIEIDVLDAEHAAARCYLLLYAGDASTPAGAGGRPAEPPQRIGEYHDELTLTAQGWRIRRREGRLVLYAGL
ncbi:MAG: nuclear transport factor 2 family protein [Steroidobacteraceae bacterium]